jgi:DNA-binding NtrC family response regulator
VALAASDVIELEDLPEPLWRDLSTVLVPSLERHETMRAWAARYARLMVERCGGRRSEAARVLGISYHTLKGHLKYPGASAAPAESREEESTIADVSVES